MSDGNRNYRIVMDQGYGRSYGKRPSVGIRFDRNEIKELAIAMGVITVAFAAVFSGNYLLGGELDPAYFIILLPFAFIATFTGFLLHELAHKVSANHYGYPAAFSYNKKYLLMGALISIVIGFLFAAPGAVFIYGRPSRKENGIISAAGPATNLAIAGLSLAAAFVLAGWMELLSGGLFFIAVINLIIGAFNMIPVMPLDGSKVWKWNKFVYITMALFFLVPLVLYFTGILSYILD
ncbi:MAG: site-2 protease family protein [Candidatus Thermoplasmatota archaeon]|nr:site-2 protease family protein [Candidatus Thermoplasmatota archaeon]